MYIFDTEVSLFQISLILVLNMKFKKLLNELKRRNVYRVALTYCITAWLLAQVASLACATFGAPDWVMKMILVVLIIGFPIALIFAWAFELSPQGFIRTTSLEAEENPYSKRQKRPLTSNILIALLVLLVIGQFLYNRYTGNNVIDENRIEQKTVSAEKLEKKSIAVLPFKNWSGDSSYQYFCDGMTDEVISRLSKIKSFDKVTSRTSVFKYKETDKSMIEIANELDVTHILEGSFNKSGDEIKIVLQLIDGATDDHFWSDEYRGTWNSNDIFKIQAEVAENVTKNLNLNISQEEIGQISETPTQNTEAYKAFLQAEFQREKNDQIGFSNAIPLYEKAIELDSMFYEAYDGLANVWQFGGLIWGQFEEVEALSKSKTLLEKSLKIKDHVYARQTLFSLEFYYNWNFNYCEKEIENLTKNMKNIEQGTGILGDYLMKVGRYQESLNYLDSYMSSRDLVESFIYAHKAKVLFLVGKVDEALEIVNNRQSLYLDDQLFLRESIQVYFYTKNYARFKELVNIINTNFSERAAVHIWFDLNNSNLNRDNVKVDKYIKELEVKYKNQESGSPAWFIAMYYFFIKEKEKGFIWLQRSYDRHEVEMTWLREEPLLQPFIGDPRYQKIYKAMGWPSVNGR